MIERFGLVPINSKTVKVGDVFGRLNALQNNSNHTTNITD